MRNAAIEKSLDKRVLALCADYPRRVREAARADVSPRVEIELKYINAKIYDSVAEVVGERFAEAFIMDIGGEIGFAKTDVVGMSESTYKIYKKHAKENIAKRLHLTD